jgi:hypothetical protein
VPLETAWRHLARVEHWPTWASHIKQVQLRPPGQLGPQSTGVIHLTNGVKSAFAMTEFNPHRNWKWVGRFLWLTIHYNHRFEQVSEQETRLIWTVEAEGFGASVFGRLFAKIYNKNLNKAIPALVAEMSGGGDGGAAATKPKTAPAATGATMNFTVEEVFYIKPPVDRVILVGTISEGSVRVGQTVVVHTSAGPINAVIDNIESIQQGDLRHASKGQQVGLRLTGIRKDQPSKRDRVTAAGGE